MNDRKAYREALEKYDNALLLSELEYLAKRIVEGNNVWQYFGFPSDPHTRLEIVTQLLREREKGKGINDGDSTINKP